MRKIVLPLALTLTLAPFLATAQEMQQARNPRGHATTVDPRQVIVRMQNPLDIENCFGCVLGIWDDPGLTQRTGTIAPGTPKDLYIGVKFASPYDGLTGLEFSISGIRQAEDGILVLSVDGLTPIPPTIILGTVPSPADTSATSGGTGGINIAWSSCIQGSQALLKIQILTFSPISEKVIWVKHRYPPTNPMVSTPLFTQCDVPNFTATRVTGGCYGLNFTGTLPCDSGTDLPPVCDAGGPYTPVCTTPITSVALDGTGSFDPEGNPLTYSWSTDCPAAVISNSTSPMPTLSIATPPGSNTTCNVILAVNDGASTSSCSTTVSVECGAVDRPPVCDAGGPYEARCAGPTTAIELDGTGSFDPDIGDSLVFSWSSDCPGASFDDATSARPTLHLDSRCCPISCSVTLVVSDGRQSSTCNAPVHLAGEVGPPLARVLWPPDHKYVRIEPSDCVASGCRPGGPLGVRIVSVRSDELEDAQGQGDGATLDDIVIECPDVVLLRAERAGNGNGRVYTITYEVGGPNGPQRVECKVSVPHDQSGAPAVDGPGPGYNVTGACGVNRSQPQTAGNGSAAPDPNALKPQLSRGEEPGISVSFALDTSGPVSLDVYDIAGRHVGSVRAELSAGSHVLRWNGRDTEGREVSSGIYLMRLRAGGNDRKFKALWMR